MLNLPQYYDRQNIISEILQIWYSRQSRRKLQPKRTSDFQRYQEEQSADNTLFVCPKCELVFELPNQYNGQRELYYYHIPKIGKKQKICDGCKNKKGRHENK